MKATVTEREKLLYTKREAMRMLDVGDKTFRGLGLTFVMIGKRKRYALEDIKAFIVRSRRSEACLSQEKGRGRRITGMTLQSQVYDIGEVRKRIAQKLRNQSSQS